ncbi:MAG: efflux RND transporter periplasmic adaptor subunit [Clostridia bacterium]|nr:efflux RND transporter periplasmic adaptor subunit [Clostridia bacterium]
MAQITDPQLSKDAAANAKLDRMVAGEKKKKNRRIIAGVLATAALLFWFGLRPMIIEGANKDSGYRNYAAERRDITVTVGGSGALQPADSYNIIGLVQGDILMADFEEGDYVNKDDLLFSIDSSDAERSIEQAEIALRNAGLSYDSVVDAVDGLEPKASASGRIMKLYVKMGDEVTAGAMLAEIRDIDNMELTVPFHQLDASGLSAGMAAQVTMTDSGELVQGIVSRVSGAVKAGIGGILTCDVEILVSNPGGIADGAQATAVVNGVSCASSGIFASRGSSMVMAGTNGTVTSVYVSEGDRVSRDQALMAIDSDAAQRQLEQAQLGVRSSELSLENARNILENYTIKAPISGTVVVKNYKAGDTLDSTSAVAPMAVIYDMSYLTLTLNVDELYIRDVEIGQKVYIEADAVDGETFTGYIDRIGINGTVASGVTTYPVRVIIEEYGELLPGMNVTADIVIEEAIDVLTVPISAVNRGNTVFVVDPESKGDEKNNVPEGYRSAEVEVGRSDEDYIEIISGISEGEEVGVSTATTSLFETMINNSPMVQASRDD